MDSGAVSAEAMSGVVVLLLVPLVLAGFEVARLTYLERRRDRIPILLYHRLARQEDLDAGVTGDGERIYVCGDARFADQMQWLADRGFAALSMDAFIEIRRGSRPMPARPVVVTFDDGYLSNLELGLPILARHGLTATVFAVLEPDEESRNLVAGRDSFLSLEQMRILDRAGIAIESHTLTHCILSELSDEEARAELVESRRRLEAGLGRVVRHLAVPRSGWSRRVRRLAHEAGYETVCCNRKGGSTGWSDPLGLPRLVVERDTTMDQFRRLLEPGGAVGARFVGNLKRMPEVLLGPSRARALRVALEGTALAGLLGSGNLQRVLLWCGAAYAGVLAVLLVLLLRG